MTKGKEAKVQKLDNGFLITIIDLDGDNRVPVAKYVATDIESIAAILSSKVFPLVQN